MQNYGWLIFALLGALFAGMVNVMAKRALDRLDFGVGLAVMGVAMTLTIVIATTVRRQWSTLADATWPPVLLIGSAGVCAGLSWIFGYRALQLADVARTAPLDKLSMPIAVLLAVLFLAERPTALNIAGIALMVIGAFFVARA